MRQNHKLKLANRISKQRLQELQRELATMQKCQLKAEIRALLAELLAMKQLAKNQI